MHEKKENEQGPSSVLKNQNQAIFEIIPKGSNHLIPRVVVTNIIVYLMNVDMQIRNAGNGRQHRPDYPSKPASGANIQNMYNDMELHKAAESGDTEAASKAVADNPKSLHKKDPKNLNLPLHVAVDKCQKNVALYLIGIYPQGLYALNRSNISPFYLAVVRYPDDWKFIDSMLKIAKPACTLEDLQKGKSVLRAAIEHKNQGMLKTILYYHPELLEYRDEEGLTPLSYAASKGYVDIVGYIMKKFPKSIYFCNKDESYPIHKACLGGHLEVLKKFHPKHWKAVNKQGRTILHLAAMEPNNKLKPVVSYLLSLPPDGKKLIEMRDESGRTPLMLATNNHEVKVLLEEFLK